jgi:regulator of protease activity HflC (stomatin/prohibitin superfamily)
MAGIYIAILIIVFLLFYSLRVVKQYERGVIFFLGKFTGIRGPGLIILIPIFEKMTRVNLRTITMNIPSQKIITKDNVSIDIAAVAYYHIVDPEKAVIAIENVESAVNQISQTTVRNVVGQFMLDQLLSQTVDINTQIKNVIDAHTEPWGAQVTAVEIKDIVLPDNMQRAMAKEAEAERERRAKIVAAEGEFQAAVKLGQAADLITAHPVALQLRTLQTLAEISIEKNSTIIFPAQFMTTVKEALQTIKIDSEAKR